MPFNSNILKVNPPSTQPGFWLSAALPGLVFALLLTAFGQPKMTKVKISEGITVAMPKTFYPMEVPDIIQRLPSVRRPIAAYTNTDRLVDFSVKISATQWRPQDIPMMKEFFKASVINLYDKVDFSQDTVRAVNGQPYAIFEFDSYIGGDRYAIQQTGAIRKYSYVQYTIRNGQTIVFSFNAPFQEKAQWQTIAKTMMESIQMKG